MNTVWIRRIAIGLAVLLVLLIGAAALLVATFDANRFKGLAIDWMRTERQRTLAIDGPIELSVFPRLAIKVSKVRLSEHAKPDEFLAIDEAALAVQTLPLLRKQVVVDRVSARGVRAVYSRDAKGTRNIDDLLGGSAAAPAGAPSAPLSGGPAVRFDVSAVKLDDVQLRVRDAIAKVDGTVVLQSFSSGRLANQGESPVSLRASVQLAQPQALKAALDGDTTLALDLDRSAVALRDMKLNVQLDGAGAKDLALAATGALAWDGAALRAGPLKLALKGATFGSSALGSSIVVRSPGSRCSHTAWMARRSNLPERVFGSRVTKCTRAGRASAPSCRSTVCMISPSSFSCALGSPSALASFAMTNAIATCPFSASATPTTATSATFGWLEMLSSISRVPSRWPATLMTSSVRPRMK